MSLHLKVRVIRGRNLAENQGSVKIDLDPYPVVTIGSQTRKGAYARKVIHPVWNQTHSFTLQTDKNNRKMPSDKEIKIDVLDDRDIKLWRSDNHLSSVAIQLKGLVQNLERIEWYPLKKRSGEPGGDIEIGLLAENFGDIDDYPVSAVNPQFIQGYETGDPAHNTQFMSSTEMFPGLFASGMSSYGLGSISQVPEKKLKSYEGMTGKFPLHRGCKLDLFQDAHCAEDSPPFIYQETMEAPYVPGNCWEQLFMAICEAKKFIYITGWSVFTEIKLLRRPFPDPRYAKYVNMTVGELLKEKGNEGCTVLLLLWNEKLSTNSVLFGNSTGLMNVHDEATKAYFNGTNVHVSLAYRRGIVSTEQKSSIIGMFTNPLLTSSMATEYLWTHHQKTVIYDAPVSATYPHLRKVNAFVGGLDLTNGRWDTPAHSLFRTIEGEHSGVDFYQNCAATTAQYGPREPWHDIHSKVEGPVAYDVLKNFTQRWSRQKTRYVNKLYPVESDKDILKEADAAVLNDPNSFSMQLFRSIDSSSATIDGVERDIQGAYIQLIRAANKFLYFENQYWIGSSKIWLKNKDIAISNLIPFTIAEKICKCIKNGNPFAAYCLIPLFPEGNPSDGATQQILAWQFNTISAMYHMIAQELKNVSEKNRAIVQERPHPTDWLMFFCLGNREINNIDQPIPPSVPQTPFVLHHTRRHQIYVHSKMLIVDDDYIVVGSANVNDRSMMGDRDTEICVGGFQPSHLTDKNGASARGNIHKFRMSLFSEHFKLSEYCFLEPSSYPCIARAKQLASFNWDRFTSRTLIEDLTGHMMTYPLGVNIDGGVYPDPMQFPDTDAKIAGTVSAKIPTDLTA